MQLVMIIKEKKFQMNVTLNRRHLHHHQRLSMMMPTPKQKQKNTCKNDDKKMTLYLYNNQHHQI